MEAGRKKLNMEKIPAACAMEWSIELEKGLRSKNRSISTEAIFKIGPRLEWWNRESKVTLAEYKMFGLIPGEDKLFANAILLRLADAFRLGDKQTKVCVVKIFLEELKSRRRRKNSKKGDEGILSKNKLENYLEILRRVKTVFDDGDFEERALALALFGCWAAFAKDCADIRYVVLSSLVSEHILEAKASLFAAGCFCELAEDFALVLLEILVNMLTSCKTSMAFKMAGWRAIAKMTVYFSIANRAYKTGMKLLLDSCEEKLFVVMLISLTKLASGWTPLVTQQIELLFSFLSKDSSSHIQATTLKCLHFIVARGLCPSPAISDRIQNLVNMLKESKFPPASLYQALKVLHKIYLHNIPSLSTSMVLEVFSVLLTYFQKIIESFTTSMRLLSIGVLVDIFETFLGRIKTESVDIDLTMAFQVISFIVDHISMLVKSIVDRHQNHEEEMEQEVTSLLSLLLNLVDKHSNLGCFVLDKFCLFMEHLVNMLEREISTDREDILNCEILKFGKKGKTKVMLKLLFYVTKIMITCTQNVEVANAATSQALTSLKLLVGHFYKSTPFNSYMFRIYLLLLHSHSTYRCTWPVMEQTVKFDSNSNDSFLEEEVLSLEYARKMFEAREYWSSYNAGKLAASLGSWATSAFIFEELAPVVQSDSCSCWLKSLTLFSHSESRIQRFRLVLPKDNLCEDGESIPWKTNLCNYAESVIGACYTLRFAQETLGTSVTGDAFSFQRWFLALRVKALETFVDVTKLLGTIPFIQDPSSSRQEKSKFFGSHTMSLQRCSSLLYSSMQISYRLKMIADEYDLMVTSVMGMGRKSRMIISALATSCSLLAFSTAFALFIPDRASEKSGNCGLDSSQEKLYGWLIQDLLGRLWHVDSESCKNLQMLLKDYQKSNSCCWFGFRKQAAEISCEVKDFVELCRHAVMRIIGLKNEARRLSNVESTSRISLNGLQLLLDIISKLMQIPFRCPNFFFQIRPYVSSELFIMHEDGENIDGKSVSAGSHLLLNLCLQLNNMPTDLLVRLSKMYCVLSCTMKTPDGANEEQQASFNPGKWAISGILDLNKKLVGYLSGSAKIDSTIDCTEDKYVCFHPNKNGQGFSTCLLDISAFPVGFYRIKWHSCCIDSEGSYWSIIPLNVGPVFTIEKPSISK